MEILKKLGKSLLIGTVMGAIIAVITRNFVPDLIDRLEHQTYYMRYFWKHMELGETNAEDEQVGDESGICIVDIDDRTQHKLGMYWNWNRSYHAEMTNALKEHFPAGIVFDINFYGPEDGHHSARLSQLLERSREMHPDVTVPDRVSRALLSTIDYDEQFIDATRNAGVVYHGVRLSDEADYPPHALSQMKERSTMEWHESLNPASTVELPPDQRKAVSSDKTYVDGIFPELARAARGIGHLNMSPNEDGVIREVPLLYGFGKNKPVYLPISARVAASLFGTPNDQIHFEPGRYVDIGKPFKIHKDRNNKITCSYPNTTISQIKVILERADEILSLAPNEHLDVSSLLKIGRDSEGKEFISMNCGNFPSPVVGAFRQSDMNTALTMDAGSSMELGENIVLTRESELDLVLTAPFGDEEWYLAVEDIAMIARLDFDEFERVGKAQTKLIFHTFSVKNKGGVLISSIPVLRGEVLRDLCSMKWSEIEEMEPGFRREFGDNVRIPLTPDSKHIVTYFGPRGRPFKYYSYYDIMKDRVHGGLEGKIFLVGSTVAAMFDIVSVPMDNVYPGVEVHASLLNSFITNTFVTRLAGWQDFLILLLVGIIIGILGYLLKPLPSAILTAVFVFGYFLIAMTAFGAGHLWVEVARPILTIVLTYTAVMAYRYVTEEKDRKFLQSTFKQYLSPELIDTMYKEKKMPELGGEEGVITAYFTDIQSFSTFSEKLGSPTRLVELLNEYLTEMTDSLLAHYGTLDKYEGDAIIAFFGAPMRMEDHASQACKTALDMQRKLGMLREKWASEGDKWPTIVHDMRMRIGVNSGRITTGNMGSAVRMNYTMMGDAVNLAARLESAAKQYGVYSMISDYTYQMVKDGFEARKLDTLAVVGKSEPVVVYELIAEKGGMDSEMSKLVSIYNEGLNYFYEQKWDDAIKAMLEAEPLEPFTGVSVGGISPTRRISEYAERYKMNPPGDDWDGVTRLTSK